MTPLISVVTGTYNRLASLKRMIESARREIPRGLSYEFIIVDGGSTDGTQSWCAAQADIRLIEHGELRGAIKAFCDGARAAQGEYVLLANDDVQFKRYSILAALSHLERTPICGAVAFADNRTSIVTGDGMHYRVEGMGATLPDGIRTMVVYAQVGLFKRELGNAAGWWGDQDSIMGQARTYGGDNYLSARLWEMGYTVDAVPQAIVEDTIVRDGLRDVNAAGGPRDSTYFYARFPTVHIPEMWQSVSQKDRLRILNLPIYERGFPQSMNLEAGLTEALVDYGLVAEVDWLNAGDFNLIELCRAWQPDLLITQVQGPGPKLTAYDLASARNLVPGMVVVNWNGDAHEIGLTSPLVMGLLQFVDLQLVVNAKVLPDYQKAGIAAAYWQIGIKDPVHPLPDMPTYEVLWQGNCYNGWRDEILRTLRNMRRVDAHRVKLGVYGNCPGADGNTHYNFAAQRALYQRATITVGDTYPDTVGFISNRVFQALAAGAFLLQQYSEQLEEYTGLVAGVHYVQWRNLADLKRLITYWLDDGRADERARIAASGQAFVQANYSYKVQARKLFENLLPQIVRQNELA